MECVRLGQSGLKVSRICLGTMTFGTPAWRPWVLTEAEEERAYLEAPYQPHVVLGFEPAVSR